MLIKEIIYREYRFIKAMYIDCLAQMRRGSDWPTSYDMGGLQSGPQINL